MRSKKKHNNEFLETIICAVVIVGIISTFGILMINKVFDTNYVNINTEDDIWEAEFRKVEENRVGIIFDGISTTDSEYTNLRSYCNQYIENSNSDINLDANINVEVTVDEDTFVDSRQDDNKLSVFNLPDALSNSKEKDSAYYSDMVETGPIYFNDLLMIRYINDLGELKIVCSTFSDDTKTNIVSFNQSDISRYYKITSIQDNKPDETSEKVTNTKQITEEAYISNISNCIKNLLLSTNIQDERNAIENSLGYFTSDGKNTVIKSRDLLELNDNTEISLVVGLAGKSDTSKTVKDRVYLQYKITNEGNESYINIIVKLNSYLRIFDIDII